MKYSDLSDFYATLTAFVDVLALSIITAVTEFVSVKLNLDLHKRLLHLNYLLWASCDTTINN